MVSKLSLEEINLLSTSQFVDHFGHLYEYAPCIMEKVHQRRPFRSTLDVYLASVEEVEALSDENRLALLRDHPELDRPDLNEGNLTISSESEQRKMSFGVAEERTRNTLRSLSARYTNKYGFPGIMCVAEHDDIGSLVQHLAKRSGRSAVVEEERALNEVCKIAFNRFLKIVETDLGVPKEVLVESGSPRRPWEIPGEATLWILRSNRRYLLSTFHTWARGGIIVSDGILKIADGETLLLTV